MNSDSQYPILHQSYDLSKHNTMALCCTAQQAVIFNDEKQIDVFFLSDSSPLNREQAEKQQTLLVLSGGSNVILPSSLNALVLMPAFTGIQLISEDADAVYIEVMAGNHWHDFVVECTNKGWFGLENLALIPGLVGASPVQNIGAYGVQLEDCLTHVKAFHLLEKRWQTLTKEDCQFGYRDSLFKQNPNTWLISRVGFKLHKNPNQVVSNYGDVAIKAKEIALTNQKPAITPVDVMHAIIAIRQSKLPDPSVLPNTGSFFQNPIISRTHYAQLLCDYPTLPKYDIDATQVKVPAGWLIEQAGLKGGGVAPILTHAKQALVLTNHAAYQANQADIATTRDLIINTVQQQFAITLKPEPVWID